MNDISVSAGDLAQFNCSFDGQPFIEIEWDHNGRKLTSSDRVNFAQQGDLFSLSILNVQLDDQGSYSCSPSKCDRESSKQVSDQEKQEPLQKLGPVPSSPQTTERQISSDKNAGFVPYEEHDIYAAIHDEHLVKVGHKQNDVPLCCNIKGGTATFIAKVGGDPIPSVKWMKGKWRQITHGGRIVVEQKGQHAKLEIRDVTKSDSGQYRCVASNKHGEIECSTELNVDEKKGTSLETVTLKKTPSKQKSPKEDKDIDIVELLRNVDPKEYEKYARMYGITDFRGLLQAIEQLKREKGEQSGQVTFNFI
uniref:Ig-like domain-containing protein n=1 Tax=Denticeps clupeoides TaxID=299321 RepID=A0AAY4EWI6_9TELE